MKFLIFLFIPFNILSQKRYAHTIPDPPTQIVYVKQYEKVDSFKLDTSYVYEFFKLENKEVYLIRVKKKKYGKTE
jgi:hypothetical protein